MFVGSCYGEFPLSSSEEMVLTFNGDVFRYDIHIDQEISKNISIKQKSPHDVYINTEEQRTLSIEKQVEYDVHIEQQVNFDLEN